MAKRHPPPFIRLFISVKTFLSLFFSTIPGPFARLVNIVAPPQKSSLSSYLLTRIQPSFLFRALYLLLFYQRFSFIADIRITAYNLNITEGAPNQRI
jgi:hypothetical protein